MMKPVSWQQVKITGSFWANWQKINQVSLYHQYRQLKKTGRIDAFRLNRGAGKKILPHHFWDSDVAKWVEATALSLWQNFDRGLAEKLEKTVKLIVSAQQKDGYLNTHFTVVEPEKRFTNLRDSHELYCAGHLIEAAVAHWLATGKTLFLKAACRYADYLCQVFGPRKGQIRGYDGHEEIELALVKLFRVTGCQRYLSLASFFVEERGKKPHFFDWEARNRGEDLTTLRRSYQYYQAHCPVRQQREVVGHAVRAMYLYCALADLALEKKDKSLLRTLRLLWEDLITKKIYVTGGIGSTREGEAFGQAYELPNDTAYCETCAACGLVFWSHRLLHLEKKAKIADIMELVLYNAALAGISLEGKTFFYVNPLWSGGNHHRQSWYDCACCPSNISRVISSVGQYAYSSSEKDIWVHLYMESKAELHLADSQVILTVKTDYPFDGKVFIKVEPGKICDFTLFLRIPGWCRSWKLFLNGEEKVLPVSSGYLRIKRTWKNGDYLQLVLEMKTEYLQAHPEVRFDIGQVALRRGPLIYCLEQVDNKVSLHRIILPARPELKASFRPELLGGITVLTGKAYYLTAANLSGWLYREAEAFSLQPIKITAIPYYAWDNRKAGQMTVWVRRQEN